MYPVRDVRLLTGNFNFFNFSWARIYQNHKGRLTLVWLVATELNAYNESIPHFGYKTKWQMTLQKKQTQTRIYCNCKQEQKETDGHYNIRKVIVVFLGT